MQYFKSMARDNDAQHNFHDKLPIKQCQYNGLRIALTLLLNSEYSCLTRRRVTINN